ncbi:flagellar motor protein MotD [Thiohalophilus sp.]|uniref:flagellar motor protein MotD n=1 Tax=Thiohalophilus sp. TaxID=3028392 RepID=UPI002ACEC545|nr:flagellar motor protein MotD [Thiohalophilus sp.]MDZ7804186.1 flagellar motor protein MotD [Thiohalophilus sp.]
MRRRQRRQAPEEENVDRWMVSYADFITLLFAFFVVMYSMSSINESKYRVLSDTMIDAFKTPPKSRDPIQIGEEARAFVPVEPLIEQPRTDIVQLKAPETTVDRSRQMAQIAEQVRDAMQPLIDQGIININQDKLWVEVEMDTRVLFPSGAAQLTQQAYPVLEELAEVLRDVPNHIDVEGHTDNQPINTLAYPSNWELSAARAASVVHLFTQSGVEPQRLSAIGYGEHRPIADNDAVEGRQRNRRVTVVILADKNARRMLEIERQIDNDQS